MKRKYIEDLTNWNNSPNRKPLIVWGARQVGKTYLIKELFAKEYYSNKYIYIDCLKDDTFTNYCFQHSNVDDIITYLELSNNMIIDKNTLLIIDEVQECLPLITMLKYFCQDHREIPVIATGSMVRVKIKRDAHKPGIGRSKFMFPVGKINQITINPLSFEEYLLNKNEMLYKKIVDTYYKSSPLDDAIHELAMNEFYNYLLIGGMPEVVNEYLETGSFQKARIVLKELYDNYLADMELYQASGESIIRSRIIFNNIFSQLNKENKNFSPSCVDKKLRTRDIRTPLDWLTLAHIVNKCSLLKEKVSIPMIEDEAEAYRLYLSDIGMFSYQSGINAATFIDKNARNQLSGIFYENYVACEMVANDIPLFYWKGKQNSELEFMVQVGNNIIPIDVKKTRGQLNSLNKFKEHNHLEYAIKISENKFGINKENKLITVPFYQAFLLFNDLKEGKDLLNND